MQTKKNAQIFETLPPWSAIAAMVGPSILGQLIVLIYSMADTFFIGCTNNPYMVAATGLILPIFNLCLPLAGLAGVGGGALISRLLGERREEDAKLVCSFSIWLSAAIASVFSLAVLLFRTRLLRLLGANEHTLDYAASYALCVIVFGGLPTVLSNVFSNLLRSVGESRKAGFGITMGGLLNIALDPLFMFVLFPDGKEVIGAGAATCLSNCISCAYFILVMCRMGRGSVLTLRSPLQLPAKRQIAAIFNVGVPSSVATLLFDLDYMVINRLMSGYGDAALAAIGIVLKVERLPLNIGVGICQGIVPIIAYNFAAKRFDRLREVKRDAMLLGLGCAAVSIVLYELFSPQIMRFFIRDAETVRLGTSFLRVRSLATVLMFLSFYHVHLFNGYGRGGEALFLGVMRWLAFNIPMLFLLNRLLGMMGLAWSQVAADCLTVLLSLFVHRRYAKRYLRE